MDRIFNKGERFALGNATGIFTDGVSERLVCMTRAQVEEGLLDLRN